MPILRKSNNFSIYFSHCKNKSHADLDPRSDRERKKEAQTRGFATGGLEFDF